MSTAIDEGASTRPTAAARCRRAYNIEHGITPQTVVKRISSLRDSIWERDYVTVPAAVDAKAPAIPLHELPELLDSLRREMHDAARELDFERAAQLRDRIRDARGRAAQARLRWSRRASRPAATLPRAALRLPIKITPSRIER